MHFIKIAFRATLYIALVTLVSTPAVSIAANYPSHQITVMVPFSAGGPNDFAARLIAPSLSEELGQPVVVENRGGGGGVPGTEAADQRHDGYTILMGGIAPLVLIPPVQDVPYNTEKDFVPLGLIWRSPQVLAIRPDIGVTSVAEFVARAKANPNKTIIGSAGQGTVSHLANELLRREAKIAFTHVPYRSTGNSLTDLLGKHIDAIFGDVSLLRPYLHSKRLLGLAVTSESRSPVLPDIMTMAEADYPNVRTEVWYGLLVSSHAPADAIAKLKAAVLKVQNDPAVRARLLKYNVTITGTGSDYFADFLQKERTRWTPVVRSIKRD